MSVSASPRRWRISGRTLVVLGLITGPMLWAGAGVASAAPAAAAAPAAPAATAGAAAPAATTAATTQASQGSGNLFSANGGVDPFCSSPPGGGSLSGAEQDNCRVSGSVSEPYPISSYGIDVQSPGVTSSIGDWIGYALQSIAAIVWQILLYVVRGTLLLLQWAFSLDLVSKGMGGLRQALAVLHDDVFGESWLEAALAALGLWGIWNGLVRRRTIETLTGLLASAALMVAALVLIAQPQATIGRVSSFANQASLATLSGLSRANVSQPAQSFATTQGGLFNALVLHPWCALEFGSVSYCTQPHAGTTVGDVWLRTPAGGTERQQLYQLATSGNSNGSLGHRLEQIGVGLGQAVGGGGAAGAEQAVGQFAGLQLCPSGRAKCAAQTVADTEIKQHAQDVSIQSTGPSTFDRLTMLALIIAGLAGAISVLFYIAIKLLFAAVKVLLLILGAPVMLLVAAFGERGRVTVVSYFTALIGAFVTKIVYAALLAIVLLVFFLLNGFAIGWLSVWLLSLVFWWGVFFERRELVQFLEMDRRVRDRGLDISGHGAPFRVTGALIGGFAAWRAVRGLTRGIARPVRAGVAHRQELVADRRHAATEAHVRQLGQGHSDQAVAGIRAEDRDRLAAATRTLNRDRVEHRTRGRAQSRVHRLDERIEDVRRQAARATPARQANLLARKARLETSRQRWGAQLAASNDRIRAQQPFVHDAQRTAGQLGRGERVIDQRERDAYNDQRRQDLLAGGFPNPATEPERFRRSLYAAGISGEEWRAATPAGRAAHLRQARQREVEDRGSFSALENARSEAGVPWTRQELDDRWRRVSTNPAVYERVRADADRRYDANRAARHSHARRVRSRRGVR